MRIAAYCRVSTDKDDQLNSLEAQREFFQAYARQNDYRLFRVYADEGITGTSLKKRAQFKRLMEDAHCGLFEAVVVKDISRFARNTVDFLQNIRALKAIGIGTTFVTNNMTTLGDSEFILTVFGAMAQEESANLSKRVKFGKDINSRKGRVPPRIYGYDRVDNFTLRINEQEAKVVRDIYNMYIHQGYGARLIALELERRGEPTKCGGSWNGRGVRRVLDNPIYSGHYVNHKYHVADFLEGKVTALPEGQNYHHDRPEWAIITPETYAQAQRIKAERAAQFQGENTYVHQTGRHSARHLFSTLIKCEHCGRSFYRYRRKRKDGTYHVVWKCTTNNQYTHGRCPNRTLVDEKELSAYISEYLSSLMPDREALARRLADIATHGQWVENTEQEDALRRARGRLENQMEKYMDLYANEVITMDALKEKLKTLQVRKDELDQKLCQGASVREERGGVWDPAREIEGVLSLETVNNVELRKILSHISVSTDQTVTIYLHDYEDWVKM